jgi:hypothetical protein
LSARLTAVPDAFRYRGRGCFKITQVSARQGKNWRESAVYME